MAITISGDSPSFASYQGGVLVSGTAQASTSGTSIDFTSIPSWVKRITVIFNGVSTNATGTSNIIVQLGVSNTAVTSGYVGSFSLLGTSSLSTGASNTSGFVMTQMPATAATWSGQMVIANVTGNTWVSSSSCARTDNGTMVVQSGVNSLAGTVTNLRVTTVNGTDTFDAGSINILYE
jgi:hypothetical protein